MAFLSILFLLLGFAFFGLGSSSGGARVVASGSGAPTRSHAHVKCSKRMGAGVGRKHCGGPPANP